MKLVFATNNEHKLFEVRNLLQPVKNIEIVSLKEIGINEEIPEDADTLEGNASQKAFYIYNKTKLNCIADDTGLEIEALNGRPGVYSARYAGKGCSFEDNVCKVLAEMQNVSNRKARFRTVASLIIDGKEKLFEGMVEGEILHEPRGKEGFGYDPIFKPEGFELSFAEMNIDVKNTISHRARAFLKLLDYLRAL